MTINDVINIANLYREISYHPMNSEVRFGCDCGCGGDSYSRDKWEELGVELDAMNERLESLCFWAGIDL